MSSSLTTAPIDSPDVPLCRSYTALLFERLTPSVVVGAAQGPHQTLLLAMGVLSNGDCELVGCWPARHFNGAAERAVSDLKRRGVELIRFLGGVSSDDWSRALQDQYPTAVIVESKQLGVVSDFYDAIQRSSALKGRRRLAAAQNHAMERVRRARHALARHGAVPSDLSAASALVLGVLRRAERDGNSGLPQLARQSLRGRRSGSASLLR